METFVRRHRVVENGRQRYYEREYTVYHKDDPEAKELNYKPWHECQPGDWGLSDDGYIAECLKVREYAINCWDETDRKNKYFVFSFGSAFHTAYGSGKLLYLPHKKTGIYAGTSGKPPHEFAKRVRRHKMFIKAYVMMVMAGKIDYAALGKIINPNSKSFVATAKHRLKLRWVKEMIDKELEKVLLKEDVTRQRVVQMIKEAAAIAKNKNDAANLLRAAENFMDLYHMKEKRPHSNEIPGSFSVSDVNVNEVVAAEEDRVKKLEPIHEETEKEDQ